MGFSGSRTLRRTSRFGPPPPPPEQASPFEARRVLVEIVASILHSRDPDRVVIPLSDGLDSRGLLGAVLEIAPVQSVLAVTYGDPDGATSIRVRRLCKRLNVEWVAVDPDRIHFDAQTAVAVRFADKSGLEPLVAGDLKRFLNREIDSLMGNRDICLSGFLGGSLSGSRLSNHNHTGRDAVERFVRGHTESKIPRDKHFQEQIARISQEFLADQRSKWPSGFSDGDFLDLGFRQLLWIRSVMADIRSCVAPFEDSRWVNFWKFAPYAARHHQSLYREMLRDSFPAIFSLPADKVRGKKRQGIGKRIWRHIQGPTPLSGMELSLPLGDPRRNESLFRFFEDLMESLDEVINHSTESFVKIYRRALVTGNVTDWRFIMAVSTFELERRAEQV